MRRADSYLQFVADTCRISFRNISIATNHLKCVPKVSWHEAVEDKVGGAVDENQHVNRLSNRVVTLQEELLPIDNWQDSKNALDMQDKNEKLSLINDLIYLWKLSY